MELDKQEIKNNIREKIVELARRLDVDAAELDDDDIIPATGLLDSAAILELVVWYDEFYGIGLTQEEINIDNLGSVNAMADYLLTRKSA